MKFRMSTVSKFEHAQQAAAACHGCSYDSETRSGQPS